MSLFRNVVFAAALGAMLASHFLVIVALERRRAHPDTPAP